MGSVWMTLSTRAASAVLDFLDRRPDVRRAYERSICADESLILTVLLNSPGLRVNPANHHYLRMVGVAQAHPAVLTAADFDALVASGKPFGRKFDDQIDRQVLDRLDAEALGLS
jgi:hypothetical protein